MNSYIISYDLRNNRDYTGLINWIKSYGTYANVLESLWIVYTSQSATEIRDFLLKKIDSDDHIFVVKLLKEAAWNNVLCTNDWLKTYL